MSAVLSASVDRAEIIGRELLRRGVRLVLRAVPPAPTGGLDPDLRRVARIFGQVPDGDLPVSVLRAMYVLDSELWQGPVPAGVQTLDEQLELPADASGPARSVRVRTYTPAHDTGVARLVYVHGGGFCLGSVVTHDEVCRRLASGAGVSVQSVEYRLAPEHPFPAGLTDIVQAWRLLQARWIALGGEASRIGIGGDSAGGHAAATVCDEVTAPTLGVTDLPMPGFAWMTYPATELAAHGPRIASVLTTGGLLSGPMVERFARWHLGDGDPEAPALNPGRAPDEVLAAHPPTWIQTVGFDPLRAEGERYAARMAELGVEVDHEHAETMAHAYVTMTGVSPGAASAVAAGVAGLRRLAHP